jgi:hypothetical protein
LRALHEKLLSKAEAEYDDSEAEDVMAFDEFSEIQSDFDTQIHRDLEILGAVAIAIDGDSIAVRFEQVTPLLALATDALVRYEYPAQSVMPYLLDLLSLSE